MMRTIKKIHQDRTAAERAKDVKLLQESAVHKLVITDRDGNCLAYLVAWGSFGYDPDTDTFVCCVDDDGGELMNIYAEGEVKAQPGTVISAPDADAEAGHRTIDEAS